jgi:hypothetical protein
MCTMQGTFWSDFPDPPTPHRVMCVVYGCVRNPHAHTMLRVFGDSLCAPMRTLTPSHSGSQSQQQQQQHIHCVCVCVCVCMCVCLLLLVGWSKTGPFLGTSGRTWDMKKNSWAPKLFYDNIPAHGGSTPQSTVWHDDGLIHVGPSGSKRNTPCSV